MDALFNLHIILCKRAQSYTKIKSYQSTIVFLDFQTTYLFATKTHANDKHLHLNKQAYSVNTGYIHTLFEKM